MKKNNKKTDIEAKIGEFEQRCHHAGLKITPQRIEVYKALLSTDAHPSAEDVFTKVRETMANISFDTVNRTLLTLTEIGAAFIVEGTGQPRRFDAGLEDHQHFRCIKCGRIIDFHHPPFDGIQVPEVLQKSCKVLRKSVYFEGYCGNCLPPEN